MTPEERLGVLEGLLEKAQATARERGIELPTRLSWEMLKSLKRPGNGTAKSRDEGIVVQTAEPLQSVADQMKDEEELAQDSPIVEPRAADHENAPPSFVLSAPLAAAESLVGESEEGEAPLAFAPSQKESPSSAEARPNTPKFLAFDEGAADASGQKAWGALSVMSAPLSDTATAAHQSDAVQSGAANARRAQEDELEEGEVALEVDVDLDVAIRTPVKAEPDPEPEPTRDPTPLPVPLTASMKPAAPHVASVRAPAVPPARTAPPTATSRPPSIAPLELEDLDELAPAPPSRAPVQHPAKTPEVSTSALRETAPASGPPAKESAAANPPAVPRFIQAARPAIAPRPPVPASPPSVPRGALASPPSSRAAAGLARPPAARPGEAPKPLQSQPIPAEPAPEEPKDDNLAVTSSRHIPQPIETAATTEVTAELSALVSVDSVERRRESLEQPAAVFRQRPSTQPRSFGDLLDEALSLCD